MIDKWERKTNLLCSNAELQIIYVATPPINEGNITPYSLAWATHSGHASFQREQNGNAGKKE